MGDNKEAALWARAELGYDVMHSDPWKQPSDPGEMSREVFEGDCDKAGHYDFISVKTVSTCNKQSTTQEFKTYNDYMETRYIY